MHQVQQRKQLRVRWIYGDFPEGQVSLHIEEFPANHLEVAGIVGQLRAERSFLPAGSLGLPDSTDHPDNHRNLDHYHDADANADYGSDV